MSWHGWNATNPDRSSFFSPHPTGQFFRNDSLGRQQNASSKPGLLGPCPLLPPRASSAGPALGHAPHRPPPMNPFLPPPSNPLFSQMSPLFCPPFGNPSAPPVDVQTKPPLFPSVCPPPPPPTSLRPTSHHSEPKRTRVEDAVLETRMQRQFTEDKHDKGGYGARKLPMAPSSSSSIPAPPRISEKILWEYPTPLVDSQPSKNKGTYPRPPPAPVISSSDQGTDFKFRAPSLPKSSGNQMHGDTIPLMLKACQRGRGNFLEHRQEDSNYPFPINAQERRGEKSFESKEEKSSICQRNPTLSPSNLESSVAGVPSNFDFQSVSRSVCERDSRLNNANVMAEAKRNAPSIGNFNVSSVPPSYGSKYDNQNAEKEGNGDDEDYTPPVFKDKFIMDEDRPRHVTPDLPDGWIVARHVSGMPVFLHRESRVATFARPYKLIGSGLRATEPPLASVPCLAWSTPVSNDALETPPKVSIEELHRYCKERFGITKPVQKIICPKPRDYTTKKSKGRELKLTLLNGESLTIPLSEGVNPRAILSNYVSRIYGDVSYAYSESGRDSRSNIFFCNCIIKGKVVSTGIAFTKKAAMDEAAYKALMMVVPNFPMDSIKKDFKWADIGMSLEEKLRTFFQDRAITDTSVVEELFESRDGDLRRLPSQLLASLLDVEEEQMQFTTDGNARPGCTHVTLEVPARLKKTFYMFERKCVKNKTGVRCGENEQKAFPAATKGEMNLAKEMAAHQMIREEFPLMMTWWEVVKAWFDAQIRKVGEVNVNPIWPEIDRIKFSYSRMTYLCSLLRQKGVIHSFHKSKSGTGVRFKQNSEGPWVETERLERIEILLTKKLRAELMLEGYSV